MGTAKYLKEQNPNIVAVGIDTYGSVFKKYKETGIFDENEIYPYLTEGFGEDILPKNVNFDVIDQFIKVNGQRRRDCSKKIVARRRIVCWMVEWISTARCTGVCARCI